MIALELRRRRRRPGRSTTARPTRSRPTSTTRRRARRPSSRRSTAWTRSRSRAGDDLEEVPERRPTPGMQNPLDFGNLTAGGMQPIAGPIYRYNAQHGRLGRLPGVLRRLVADQQPRLQRRLLEGSPDAPGQQRDAARARLAAVQPRRHRRAQQNGLVIGTQFGDDGALYMGRYPVGCCRNNTNAATRVQIVKVSFEVYEESTAPTTTVALDPATPGAGRTYAGPVTVNFTAQDAAGSRPDRLGHRLHRAARDAQRRPGRLAAHHQRRHVEPVPGTSAPLSDDGQLRGRVPRGRPRRQRRGRPSRSRSRSSARRT